MVIALKEEGFFERNIFDKWVALNNKIDSFPEVDFTLSTNNANELIKDEQSRTFVLKSILDVTDYDAPTIEKFKQKLLELPFYQNILYDWDFETIRSVSYTHLTLPTKRIV